MKKLFTTAAIALIILTLTACASTPKQEPAPAWMPESEAAFPRADFIAQLGEGASEADAQTQAVQALSRYISTTVEANLTALKTTDSFDYTNLIELTSHVDMYGLQLTEGWLQVDKNKWYTVAYINRDEAWEQYVPVIDQAKREFYAFYDKAEAEAEPLIAYQYLTAAWNARLPFLTALETGRLISPEHEKAYDADREVIAAIPAQQKAAWTNATLTVQVAGESGNTLSSCLSGIFSGIGFTVSKKGVYHLEATFHDNAVTEGELVLVYPELDLFLTNDDGRIIFSWSCALGKSAAYSTERALQRGLQALTDEMNANIAEAFDEASK